MTEKKKKPGKMPATKRKEPGAPEPVPMDREKRKTWNDIQREHEEKIKELLYEDRNGFKPPRPWYED